jgi:hypothetical protein
MTQRSTGWLLIIIAIVVMIGNLGDAIKDLQTWHAATTPQVIGAILKQLSATGLAAFGGKLLPTGDR